MPTTVLKTLRGATTQTLLSTGAALASAARALGSAITLTDAGYLLADVFLDGTFAGVPAANTGVRVWFLREDGEGGYEDGDASTTPARPPDCVIDVRPVTTAQRAPKPGVLLPPGPFKCLAVNDETGQQIGSGWTIRVRAFTYAGTS